MMGLFFRLKKRKAAHYILKELTNRSPVFTKVGDMELYNRQFIFIKTSDLFTTNFSEEVIRAAAHMLWKSDLIQSRPNNDWNSVELQANINGMYAYEDGFYLNENLKDISSFIETATRWIIPIIALVISIIALFIAASKN